MRRYLVDDKGVEHIVHLAIENWWVGDRESWVMLAPSAYCIDAWEDTELLLITRADTLKLAQECPALMKCYGCWMKKQYCDYRAIDSSQ